MQVQVQMYLHLNGNELVLEPNPDLLMCKQTHLHSPFLLSVPATLSSTVAFLRVLFNCSCLCILDLLISSGLLCT